MSHGIYNAVSGAVAQIQRMDMLSNNLANVSTATFKSDEISFAEVLARAARKGVQPGGSFVRTDEIRRDLHPGMLRQTDSPNDVALEGPGYLCVVDRNRELYTRGGTLEIRSDGVLTDRDGLPLLGLNNKPIRPGIDGGPLTIQRDGTVLVDQAQIGQLKLVEFERPELLDRQGSTRYAATSAVKRRRAATTTVRQGEVEQSNVNAVRQISSMIIASRSYEAFHRVISTMKEIDHRTATTLGQVTG